MDTMTKENIGKALIIIPIVIVICGVLYSAGGLSGMIAGVILVGMLVGGLFLAL